MASLEDLAKEILARGCTVAMWIETVTGPDQTCATSWIKGNPSSLVGACRLLSREVLGYADSILYGEGD